MSGVRTDFLGLLGYRRSRRNILGMQARLVLVESGVLRVIAVDGSEEERVTLADATVGLRRGLVRVEAEGRAFFLFGLGQLPRPGRALLEGVPADGADVVVGPSDGTLLASALDAAAAGRRTLEALIDLGARPDAG